MPSGRDNIPTRDADFDGWLENLVNYITQKTTPASTRTDGTSVTWTSIPEQKVQALWTVYRAWHEAYRKVQGDRSKSGTEAKNHERKNAEAFIRPFVKQYLMFEPVTDEDRVAMRLHNTNSVRVAAHAPKSQPVITDVRALGGFVIEGSGHDEDTPGTHAVPHGCNGGVMSWVVTEAPTSDYAVLLHSTLITRFPFRFEFQPEDEGKYFCCAMRWQSTRGELGPWSDIVHTRIY